MWKNQRRFANVHLKHFGEGKKALVTCILEECHWLCQAVKEEQGRPFDPQSIMNNAVANVICSVMFGHRFDYSDTRFQTLPALGRRSHFLNRNCTCSALRCLSWTYEVLARTPPNHFFTLR
uniref:Uncharacterized protein n=1 Tax=Anguilla anguilla TaxID=7936 RepID=A0A0E9WUC6_ANGAN